ncbi:MAG: M48 family metallopeptidase [Cyanobacteriota bacterium]|nr:M48 family metallopeptidase [Cyanobacteriota bacterium]
MTNLMNPPYRLTGISSKAYEHPADRAATAALRKIPHLDRVIRKLFDLGLERSYRQRLLGNGIEIGPNQLPELWSSCRSCFETLDIEGEYPLYLLQTPEVNAMAFGVHNPMIVLQSGLLSILDPDEIKSVIAHEVGHIHSQHVHYSTVMFLLLSIGGFGLPLGDLPMAAIRLSLLEWYRAAELTCDRAAALVLRDPRIYCRTLMKLAGGNVPGLNVDAFIQQASRYEAWDDTLGRGLRFFDEVTTTHPNAVRRVSELTRWIQSGDYDRIIAGDYVRRGQEPPASVEFEDAVDHYMGHFTTLIESTGEGVKQVSRGLSEWLRVQTNI